MGYNLHPNIYYRCIEVITSSDAKAFIKFTSSQIQLWVVRELISVSISNYLCPHDNVIVVKLMSKVQRKSYLLVQGERNWNRKEVSYLDEGVYQEQSQPHLFQADLSGFSLSQWSSSYHICKFRWDGLARSKYDLFCVYIENVAG